MKTVVNPSIQCPLGVNSRRFWPSLRMSAMPPKAAVFRGSTGSPKCAISCRQPPLGGSSDCIPSPAHRDAGGGAVHSITSRRFKHRGAKVGFADGANSRLFAKGATSSAILLLKGLLSAQTLPRDTRGSQGGGGTSEPSLKGTCEVAWFGISKRHSNLGNRRFSFQQ